MFHLFEILKFSFYLALSKKKNAPSCEQSKSHKRIAYKQEYFQWCFGLETMTAGLMPSGLDSVTFRTLCFVVVLCEHLTKLTPPTGSQSTETSQRWSGERVCFVINMHGNQAVNSIVCYLMLCSIRSDRKISRDQLYFLQGREVGRSCRK